MSAYRFRKGFDAFGTISFEFASFCLDANTINVFIGPNGIGKSTFAKVMCGILDRRLGGEDPASMLMHPQEELLFKGTVESNLNLVAKREGGGAKKQLASMADDFGAKGHIELANAIRDIRGWLNQDVSELSGGQRQVTGIIRTLMAYERQNWQGLILDEPTKQLSPHRMRIVRELISHTLSARTGAPLVVLTHDFYFVEHVFLIAALNKYAVVFHEFSTQETLSSAGKRVIKAKEVGRLSAKSLVAPSTDLSQQWVSMLSGSEYLREMFGIGDEEMRFLGSEELVEVNVGPMTCVYPTYGGVYRGVYRTPAVDGNDAREFRLIVDRVETATQVRVTRGVLPDQ